MADWPLPLGYGTRSAISTGTADCIGNSISAGGTTSASAVWPAANRALFYPFVVHSHARFVKGVWANGTAVAGNVDVGIYDEFGNRLVSSGSVAQAGTSVYQEADFTDTTLGPGIYYMAMASDDGTAQFVRWNPAAILLEIAGVLSLSSAFPLPSDASGWTFMGNTFANFVALVPTANWGA